MGSGQICAKRLKIRISSEIWEFRVILLWGVDQSLIRAGYTTPPPTNLISHDLPV